MVIASFLRCEAHPLSLPLCNLESFTKTGELPLQKDNMKTPSLLIALALATWASSAMARDICNCKGYAGPGGPCYSGPGGPAYNGPGGPAYAGPGGPCSRSPGGERYDGPGVRTMTAPAGLAIRVLAARLMMDPLALPIQDRAGRATAVLGALVTPVRAERGRLPIRLPVIFKAISAMSAEHQHLDPDGSVREDLAKIITH